MKRFFTGSLFGIITGFLNGFFGSGGGVAAVLLLKHGEKLDDKTAHATSVFVIMILCIFSGFLYLKKGNVALSDVWRFLPGGIIGGAAGAVLLRKIRTDILKILFGILLVYSGVRIFI